MPEPTPALGTHDSEADRVAALFHVAQEHVKRFNVCARSHRRLSANDQQTLAKGGAVHLQSGTPERPVILLTLTPSESVVAASVTVDQSLPPRMREQAEAIARQFRESLNTTNTP